MLGKRFPDHPGRDELYRARQVLYIANNHDYIEQLRDTYQEDYELFYGTVQDCMEHFDDPHIKRELRMHCMAEMEEDGILYDDLWILEQHGHKCVLYKIKKHECAKPLKYVRCIGDLGVGASLQGFRCTAWLKEQMSSKPTHVNGGDLYFVPHPKPPTLKDAFEKLFNPEGRFAFIFFSDDSCLGYRVGDRVLVFNIDISGCDASHTPSLFDALVEVAGVNGKAFQTLVDQCACPMLVRSLINRRNKVILQAHEHGRNIPVLYSGSTLTTVINNLACLLIGHAISKIVVPEDATLSSLSLLIVAAAAEVGYHITITPCEVVEDCDFLKHAYIETVTGDRQAMLVPGVALRASGSKQGDVPGRGPLKPRCVQFQSALIHGMYPRTDATFVNQMKESAGIVTNLAAVALVAKQLEYKVDIDADQPTHTFLDDSIYRRYRLNGYEISEFQDFCRSGYGQRTSNTALSKILKKDYGLECVTDLPDPQPHLDT